MKQNFMNKSINNENIFNSSLSNHNTPFAQPPPPMQSSSSFHANHTVTSTQGRKISLQPLASNTPRSSTSQTNSPIDLYLNPNRNKRNQNNSNYSFSSQHSHSSPNFIISPRNGAPIPTPTSAISYSGKVSGSGNRNGHAPLPSLFDYIVTPIKSDSQTNQVETPVLISDFKNKFQQSFNSSSSSHRNFKTHSNNTSASTTPINSTNSNIINNNNSHYSINSSKLANASNNNNNNQSYNNNNNSNYRQNNRNNQEIELVETKRSESRPRIDHSKLGNMIKNSLNEKDLEKVSILAKLYAQLIMNNFIVTINTELFFLFQLLTLNSLEDKNESQNSGKFIHFF